MSWFLAVEEGSYVVSYEINCAIYQGVEYKALTSEQCFFNEDQFMGWFIFCCLYVVRNRSKQRYTGAVT